MNEKPIWYEPHPVSPERKQHLLSRGYRIIDIAYKPKDAQPQAEEPAGHQAAQPQVPKAGRARKPADKERE